MMQACEEVDRAPAEWRPWMAFVEETLREAAAPAWDAAVPAAVEPRPPDAPLLAGAVVVLDPAAVAASLRRLHDVLSRRGTPALTGVATVLEIESDALALFAASLARNPAEAAAADASRCPHVDPDALAAVASMLPVPFLHACHRRLASHLTDSWTRGYCPVCGSWPAFAEVLDIDRSRRFRCGRCGAGWHAELLSCAFCGTRDHTELVTLVSAEKTRRGAVDACMRCSGYVKSFTTLEPCAPTGVMLHDLATSDLDFAAIEQGYRRPGGTGYPLGLRVGFGVGTAS